MKLRIVENVIIMQPALMTALQTTNMSVYTMSGAFWDTTTFPETLAGHRSGTTSFVGDYGG